MSEMKSTSFLESVDLCFNQAAEAMDLPKGINDQDKQLVYKGESVSQVCDRTRLEIMRPSRHQMDR